MKNAKWSWDTVIEVTTEGMQASRKDTCPTCGGNIFNPFTECLDCEKQAKNRHSAARIPQTGHYPTLAERLASDMTADRFGL